MRKKLLSVALCATMVAGLLAGCGSSSKSDKSSSEKGSVYWLNFKPEADEALQGIAKTYEKENGVKVKVVTAASGNYNSTLTSEMGKSAAPTLFVVGNQAAVKTWDDYCIDLKDTDVYKELSTDAFNLKDENGKVASMGYCYESYGIIVNKKLLKKAGYEITDIKDFASLKSVAEDIHKRADKLGFDAFTSSGMDDASSWRFTGHLANMSLFYEGRVNCFSPKTYLDKQDITVIRPMVYIEEYMTKKSTKEFNYPVIVNPCPANGSTKRQDVKELLAQLNSTMPGVKKNIFGALNNSEKLFIWDKDKIK